CVCVCVCVYVYVFVYVFEFLYVCGGVCTCQSMCLWVRVCARVSMCLWVCVCVRVCLSMCLWVCARVSKTQAGADLHPTQGVSSGLPQLGGKSFTIIVRLVCVCDVISGL